jgi:hypothetical protein
MSSLKNEDTAHLFVPFCNTGRNIAMNVSAEVYGIYDTKSGYQTRLLVRKLNPSDVTFLITENSMFFLKYSGAIPKILLVYLSDKSMNIEMMAPLA